MNWKVICEILLVIFLSVTSYAIFYVYPILLSITIPILVLIVGMWLKRIFEKPHVDEEKIGKAVAKELSMLEEEKKKKAQLSRHYLEIKEHVLKRWLNLSSATTQFIEGSQMVTAPIYLNTWSTINVNDKWHIWTMQHIENGYPEIQRLFEKLRIHEKEHNNFVSTFLKKFEEEILGTLPNLSEHEKSKYYFIALTRIFLPFSPLNQKDKQTSQFLKEHGIERIKSEHRKDLEKIENGIREDERLLDEIKDSVDKIIDGLELEKPLKGKCDYERVLE